MILQDRDTFIDLAEFDPDSKRVDRRKRAPGELVRMSGWIGRIGNDEILFYKRGGELWLFVRGRELVAKQTVARGTASGDRRRFELRDAGEIVLDIMYPAPIIDPPINDMLSPGESEEDYDFALFLHRVLNDPARMAVCLEVLA